MTRTDDTVLRAAVNGIEIAYETFGDPTDPAILLVMGLGTQMIAWPDELCEALASAGHHVIRYDNRDVGLSTHIDAPVPSRSDLLLKRNVPYTIDDMAADGLALLDHLGVDRFHLVGASMGGFISQTMALRAPQRVRSLTLVMTSTGSKRVGRPTPSVIRRMATQVPAESREQAIDDAVEIYRIIGSPEHLDEALVRELAGISYDRSHDPDGRLRQLSAILAQPDRTAELRRLRMPTLIVHGLADPLVTASGGLALARAIPGATFIGHAGMGHDLPRTLWPELADDVLRLIAKAERLEGERVPAGAR
jgi:pimeloyl-ACP methyl ester carboxylesterase